MAIVFVTGSSRFLLKTPLGFSGAEKGKFFSNKIQRRNLNMQIRNLLNSRSLTKDLVTQFYASQQNRDQDPSDLIYDQLKVHKKLGLSVPKEALVDHIFVRLEPQVYDYVEARNPTTTAQLLEAQKSFDAVKSAKTEAPVLKLSDFEKAFELFTDASTIGLGAVLNQEERSVIYVSRMLSSVERNYTVMERECLAVVWTLNKFKLY
ncbi:uncharacterized protein TNCV_3188081 [Trichonephila clavipes]|nr:uncharacterized protein TNCV_3188081 [Trichonephila clavipes]